MLRAKPPFCVRSWAISQEWLARHALLLSRLAIKFLTGSNYSMLRDASASRLLLARLWAVLPATTQFATEQESIVFTTGRKRGSPWKEQHPKLMCVLFTSMTHPHCTRSTIVSR